MNRKLRACGIAAFLLLAAVAFGQQSTQNPSANQKDSRSKTLSDLTDQINQLKQRIRTLEAEQDEFRTRLIQVERTHAFPDDLKEADLEFARFDCEPEFNKAHALALAQGIQGYTLEGAAALNCTQRLARITGKAVHGLANR